MNPIPRDPLPDSTLALLSEGYLFIPNRCRRHGSDIFATRLMFERVVCMQGAEAAEIFYGGDRFTRRGAMPQTTLKLLQDKGSVQQLDGEAHRARKRMFMSLMTPDSIRRLAGLMEEEWWDRLRRWQGAGTVVLLDEVREILCRAVCRWAGVRMSEEEAGRRTRELGAMIDNAGGVGPKSWWALMLRTRTERWAAEVIERIRARELQVEGGSPVQVLASHREPDGRPMETATAAVELINLMRPTVAVARFVTFSALALHEHPERRRALAAGGPDELRMFVQEVRRFYPFFPFVGGRVRNGFAWRGHRFSEGDWVLLDLYGTNRDARLWDEPDAFRPERFRNWDESAFSLIPQGAGDHFTGHRCPGEWITIELMKAALRLLTTGMHYRVPEQDLRIDLRRMPAVPRSRFMIADVVPVPEEFSAAAM